MEVLRDRLSPRRLRHPQVLPSRVDCLSTLPATRRGSVVVPVLAAQASDPQPPLALLQRARLEPEAPAPAARVEEAREAVEDRSLARRVREPQRIRGGLPEAWRDNRLGSGELADAVGAVAIADPGGLPSSHRHLERQIVGEDVID